MNKLFTKTFAFPVEAHDLGRMAESCTSKTRSPDKKLSSTAPGSPAREGKPLFWTVTGNDFEIGRASCRERVCVPV